MVCALAEWDIKQLILAHGREVQAFLTQKLRDQDVAADLTQETFLKFAEQDGTAIAHPRAYLYQTARNLATDHLRSLARRRTDPVAHEELAEIPEDSCDPEQILDARQRLFKLGEMVGELPERTRIIFVLNRIDGLTYSEIAERLGVSQSTVQKHLTSALQHVLQRWPPK